MIVCNKGLTGNIRLNLSNFLKLQGDMTEVEMAKKLNVSRSQLWRIKKKSSAVGQEFIVKFKNSYPNEPFEDYFFVESVELNQQVEQMKRSTLLP